MTSNKIDIGAASEDDVQKFVEHAFSADFVFRSPRHLKSGRRNEATDVFVLFGDVAMPIEVKSQAANVDRSPRLEDMEWTKKNLQKAASQLKGAIKTIRAGNIVELVNDRRGDVEFSTEMFDYVYGLVVLNHVAKPFDAIDLVPELADAGAPLHVLSFDDFANLSYFLDTPFDLIAYLEMRTDLLIPNLRPKVHAEKKIFEFYLEHFEELTVYRAKHRAQDRDPKDFRPHGEAYRKIYTGRYDKEIDDSRYVDSIIECTHDTDNTNPPLEQNAQSDYIDIASHLASLPRPRRAYIGAAFRKAITKSGETGEEEFAHFSSRRRDECLLFLASHRPFAERKQRGEDLFNLLLLLKATRGVRRALGIVTEAGFGGYRSYGFMLLEEDPAVVTSRSDYGETRRGGEELFGTTIPQ